MISTLRAIDKTKICDKGLSEGLKEDRISKLPDPLICHILSFLSTKDAIRTSVLSTTWRNLWQLVLGLDLSARDLKNMDEFVIYVDKFFDFHRETLVHKLRLNFDRLACVDYASDLTTWIDAAATRRIQHLGVHCEHLFNVPLHIPLSLYTSKTLVHLLLVGVNLASAEFVSLPCLKTLLLEFVRYNSENTLDKLISCSPVLEDLTIFKYSGDNSNPLIQVRSQTLKRVDVYQWGYKPQDGLVIDAPLLQFLRFSASSIKNTKFINLGFIAKVDIDACLLSTSDLNDLSSSRSMISDFITSISRVRCLVISYATTKDIFHYLKLEPLHQFCYLSGLSAVCSISNLEMLLNLLKSCPKLESLSLRLVDYEKTKKAEVMSSTVPPCLVSSLKFVELEGVLLECGTEVKVASYFLGNSTILEKLTLWNDYKEKNVEHIRQTLHAIPICSSTCEVVIFYS